MKTGGAYRREFFARPCLVVAPELLGAYLVHRLPDGIRAGRIVEVEAYLGDGSDPGSHAHRGPTPRNRSMFGPPGHLYAYRSYGIHTCINVVCEPEGRAAALLLRALEPVAGIERMRHARGLAPGAPAREIASGPGKLTEALGIGLDADGTDLLSGRLALRRPAPGERPPRMTSSRRIGLSRGRSHRFRFCVADSPWLSRRPSRPRRR